MAVVSPMIFQPQKPILVFQNGEDMLDLAAHFQLGPLDPVVHTTYAVPQTLPDVLAINNNHQPGSGLHVSRFIDEGRASQVFLIFCQYGGSEHYFYSTYRALISSCSGVWFLINPNFDCTDGQGHSEEQIHVERIIQGLQPDQPFLVTICPKVVPMDFEEVRTRLNFQDSCQLRPHHPIGIMEIDPKSGAGVSDAVAWFASRVPHRQPDSEFCNIN